MSTAMTTTTKDSKALMTSGETDLDEVAKEREALKKEREESRQRMAQYKLQEGKNVIRVMPPVKGNKSPFHKTYVHYLRNPAQPSKAGRPVVCPLKSRNKPCIVCQKVSQLRRSSNKMDNEAASDLSASRRIYANIVNLSDPDRGVQVMEFGTKIYEEFLAYMDTTDPSSLGDITHPEKGYAFVIEREGTTKETTRYKVRPAKQSSPIAKKQWLNELHDLSNFISAMDDEKVRAVLEGKDEEAADEEDPFEAPKGEQPAAAKAGSVDDDMFDDAK